MQHKKTKKFYAPRKKSIEAPHLFSRDGRDAVILREPH